MRHLNQDGSFERSSTRRLESISRTKVSTIGLFVGAILLLGFGSGFLLPAKLNSQLPTAKPNISINVDMVNIPEEEQDEPFPVGPGFFLSVEDGFL